MRIGVFGGTFDPPHNGHLRLAHAAREQLRLDKVLWVLTAEPPHKRHQSISPVADRLAMVQAAIADEPAFEFSRVDIDRPGPHWAADTVALLARQFPHDQLVYLMGGDSLRDLPRWGRPQELLAHCSLGVVRRPGDAIDLEQLERALPGVSAKVEFVDVQPLDIASQDIRARALTGETVAGLVPEAVAREIAARGLYRDHGAAAAPARNAVPEGYREVLYWKLTESWARLVLINLLALPILAVAVPVFFWLADRIGRVTVLSVEGPVEIAALIGAIVLTLVLHELAHGVAMRVFGAQPQYGIQWDAGALYATAPGYAFTRNQYLVVTVAPLVALSLLAIVGMWLLAGTAAVPLLALCAVVNAMGACGDVYMGWLVAGYPPAAYVIDEADGMRVFMPV